MPLTSTPSRGATVAPAPVTYDLPDDFIQSVEDLVLKLNRTAEEDALTEREIGGLVDEIAPHLPDGTRMGFYNSVAAIVRRVAIRREYRETSGRTIRYWRRTFGWMTKNGNQYPELSGTFVNAAVRVATLCQQPPEYVCDWAMRTGTRDVAAMEVQFIQPTSYDQEIDHQGVSAFLRSAQKEFGFHPRWPRVMRIVNVLRAEIRRMRETK